MFKKLSNQNDEIYIKQEGKKYNLTKFGFYPEEQFYLNLINDKLKKANS
jgi:hypothetical protein